MSVSPICVPVVTERLLRVPSIVNIPPTITDPEAAGFTTTESDVPVPLFTFPLS
jgi:hypothetical protein